MGSFWKYEATERRNLELQGEIWDRDGSLVAIRKQMVIKAVGWPWETTTQRVHEELQRGRRQSRRACDKGTKRVLQEKGSSRQCLMFLRSQEENWKCMLSLATWKSSVTLARVYSMGKSGSKLTNNRLWKWSKFLQSLTLFTFSQESWLWNGSWRGVRGGKGRILFVFLLRYEGFEHNKIIRQIHLRGGSWMNKQQTVNGGAGFAETANRWAPRLRCRIGFRRVRWEADVVRFLT